MQFYKKVYDYDLRMDLRVDSITTKYRRYKKDVLLWYIQTLIAIGQQIYFLSNFKFEWNYISRMDPMVPGETREMG